MAGAASPRCCRADALDTPETLADPAQRPLRPELAPSDPARSPICRTCERSSRSAPASITCWPILVCPTFPIVRVVDPDLTARMSEWVVMQVLLHHRQFRRYDRQQAERIWAEDEAQPAAAEVRVGILGLGELGLDAARKLRALGFDVAGWSRSREIGPRSRELSWRRRPRRAARRAPTFSSRLLPLTPETRGLLNASLFAKLARDGRLGGPFLINAGRGGLQVEADIVAALDAGVLKGASLDVFETEPLPAASPLWAHPNVFVSPHNAAVSTPGAIARYIAEQILAFERGEPLRNVVDRARGY